ncbi:MAG TPA: hypothetical protein VN690_03770 [Terriglobales bacterium]|nr:hypothetical protein [Terriglobales bacterium]
MKTTVEVEDALLRSVKRYGAERGLSFRAMVERGLRQLLEGTGERGNPYRMKDCTVDGQGMEKDFSWDEIREMLYPPPFVGDAGE